MMPLRGDDGGGAGAEACVKSKGLPRITRKSPIKSDKKN
jgi:hypothetical protein